MFKALIAVCVVTQFNADGGSVCYLIESPDLHKTRAACMFLTEPKRVQVQRDFMKLNGGNMAIISQVGCQEQDST